MSIFHVQKTEIESMKNQELGRDNRIIKSLMESYREEWLKGPGQRDRIARRHFYISDVGKCDREVYYHFRHPEEKRPLADKTLVLFRHGDLYHEEIQDRLKKEKVIDSPRDMEYGLEDLEIEVTGRLDIFIKEDNGLAVGEIKSKNPYAFKAAEPDQKEIDQLLWYIYCAKRSRSQRKRNILDYGYLIYVERGEVSEFPYRVFKIDFDEEKMRKILSRFRKLREAINREEIPQRQYERDSIACQYCRFSDFCWQGVPKEEEPVFRADESVEKPEKELIDSAAEQYIKLKDEEKRLKEQLDEVHKLLMNYFKATGTEQISKNGKLIVHEFAKRVSLDLEYLENHAYDRWHVFSKPQISLIRKAVKDGLLDPEIYERAKKIEYQDRIKIKEDKNAD